MRGTGTARCLGLINPAVHPRVCGEQTPHSAGHSCHHGSSPRMRGTVRAGARSVRPIRFIPAYAGNRLCEAHDGGALPVHPRVCGEQTWRGQVTPGYRGSSPRMRGTVENTLEPHRRSRFIPAYAGNRSCCGSTAGSSSVHPRVCGEQTKAEAFRHANDGSSPRMRGTGKRRQWSPTVVRFIPAYAGNRTHKTTKPPPDAVHPRVCGEQ